MYTIFIILALIGLLAITAFSAILFGKIAIWVILGIIMLVSMAYSNSEEEVKKEDIFI